MTASTLGLAMETLGGGGGAVACFSSHAVNAATITRQPRKSGKRARAGAKTPGLDRFDRSNPIVELVGTHFTDAHQSGGGTDTSLAAFEDGSPGAPGRKRTDDAPPGPQLVRSAISSRVAGGTKSLPCLICQPPPSPR